MVLAMLPFGNKFNSKIISVSFLRVSNFFSENVTITESEFMSTETHSSI